MLAAYARSGDSRAAIHLLQRMVLEGDTPDEISFLNVLSGVTHRGLVDQGLLHFQSMRSDFRLEPKVEHYTCVLNLLSCCASREDLEVLIDTMPCLPGSFSWRSLLSACQSFQTGDQAAARLLEMDSNNAATLVMLSNMLKLPA
ncbi:hypothetical protein SELMODRAFT_101512 [Selaginella moellendorffii]|uniref:Pentacotripeptide-repeat region of PRORP domain-containing protein n=1 Tax=Selaginella moellendorffii TaxID=88036 RepID=D8RTN3_SELML|nr:hypothetical protein SELMODRAFT_101512 [Selaginella moellendorffii]